MWHLLLSRHSFRLALLLSAITAVAAAPLGAQSPTPVTDKPSGEETRAITGRVVDGTGKPVAGAEIVYPYFFLEGQRLVLQDRTDSDGRFTLPVPTKWLKEAFVKLHWTIWIYSPDHALESASVFHQLFARPEAKPAEIVLKAAERATFVVTHNGKPLQGAKVRPYYMRSQAGYEPIPDQFTERLTSVTDSAGEVVIRSVTLAPLSQVLVEAPRFGVQSFRLPELNRDRPMPLSLAPVGKLKGKILAESADWLPTVRLYFTSDSSGVGAPIGSEGIARVDRLNPDGTFEIPEMPAGTLRIQAYCAEELPGRPRYPDQLTIKGGETTELVIPFEAGTLVKGSVKIGGKPVAGATISVRYGSYRQGHSVTTDSDGNYTAYVLPGSCYRQLIVVPESYGPWEQKGVPWTDRFEVPKQDEPFTIPTIEVLQKKPVKGRLVDQDNKPLSDYLVMAILQNKISGRANTGAMGEFTLYVATEEEIEEFKVERKENVPFRRDAATVLQRAPELLLQTTVTNSKP